MHRGVFSSSGIRNMTILRERLDQIISETWLRSLTREFISGSSCRMGHRGRGGVTGEEVGS